MKEYWPKCCSSPRDPRWQFESVLSAHYLAGPLRAPFRPGSPFLPPLPLPLPRSLAPFLPASLPVSASLSLSLAASFVYSLNPQSGMRWLLGSPLSPPKCFIDELWLLLLFHMSKKVKCRPPWLHFMASHPKKQFLSPPPAYARFPLPLSLLSSLPRCPFMHPLFCFSLPSTSIQTPLSSRRFPSFWSERRGSSVLRLVLPQAAGVCSNTGAEGLLLGALRCALIASHSTAAVLCGHGYTVICFTLFTRAICCQVAGVTSPRLANVSIKSTRACLKAALFTHGVLVDRRGTAIQGRWYPKESTEARGGHFWLLARRGGRAIFKMEIIFPTHLYFRQLGHGCFET